MASIMGIWLLATAIFLVFQSQSVFGGDAGDLVSAICVGGVAHPPGYPLYTIFGRLLYLIPFSTPAWRVALLSSIPSSLVVVLVFWLVWRLTKSRLAALISSFSLAFSYLFWLYAEVPEVFSLNNLFLMILAILTFSIIKKADKKKVLLFFFVAGLSLTHHHFSLWFYPVLFLILYWFHKDYWQKNFIKKILLVVPAFFVGLLPYLYVPFTARNLPIISWNNASNGENFLKLVTRYNYGTFLSHGASLSSDLNQRLFLVYGKFLTIWENFGWLWMCLLFLGLIFLYRRQRKAFWLFGGLFFWSIMFIFYSGFGIYSRNIFSIGIYERFLLPGMIFGAILAGCGLVFLNELIIRFITERNFRFFYFNKRILSTLIFIIFLLYPLGLFLKNYKIFSTLKNDRTAENLAEDILSTVPDKSVLLLAYDTPLFDTQYLHYCLRERPDVDILHLSLAEQGFYRAVLEKNYPTLVLPPSGEKDYWGKFLELNSPHRKIYTNSLQHFKSGFLVPMGLLYRYFLSEKENIPLEELYRLNEELWKKYHSPLADILSWFRPATLADVLDYYFQPAKNTAILFYGARKLNQAEEFFEKAILFNEKDLEARLSYAQLLMDKNDCQEAKDQLLLAARFNPNSSKPYLLLVKNARNCGSSAQEEGQYQEEYEKRKKLEEGGFGEL